MTKVAYLGGAWATNIGNSFYNLGILHLLRERFGDTNVYFVPNLAEWYWRSPNIYDVVADIDADLFVLSGPCFSSALHMYRPAFDRIRDAGARLAFISVGAGAYTDAERDDVQALLGEYSQCLEFVTTRDRATYDRFRDLPCPVYDGICGSMFIDEAVNVPSLNRPNPYVVLNFDRQYEPSLTWNGSTLDILPVPPPPAVANFGERVVRKFKRMREPAREWSTRVGPYDIVRTQSGAFTKDAATLFDRPRMHYAVIPDGYFAIYKSAELVVTNRVHTVASTLVLGGSARYLTTHARARDGRQGLLDRVGAGDARTRAVTLDRSFVEHEKRELRNFLATAAAGLG